MKKWICVLFAAALIMGVAACRKDDEPSQEEAPVLSSESSEEDVSIEEEPSDTEPEEDEEEIIDADEAQEPEEEDVVSQSQEAAAETSESTAPAQPEGTAPSSGIAGQPPASSTDNDIAPPMVADAAMYRGAVKVGKQNGETVYTLTQIPGRDYGSPKLTFRLAEYTNLDGLSPDSIADGDHLEIFYGGSAQSTVDAILVRKLPSAALTVHNGTVISINPDEVKEGHGSIFLEREQGNIIIAYSPNTQFYLNFGDLKEGDRLSVYSTPASAEYDPPTADALEVIYQTK